MSSLRSSAVAVFTASLFAAALIPCYAQTSQAGSGMNVQQTRYLGAPDLTLTSALVAAGGGADFNAGRLFGVLAGVHQAKELSALQARYGKERVNDFLATFTYAIHDAVRVAAQNKVALPAPSALAGDGRALSLALVKAGTMPDGRFDVGYLEHLISRPIHVAIMHDMNADPSIGQERNADVHVILTGVLEDLRKLYSS